MGFAKDLAETVLLLQENNAMTKIHLTEMVVVRHVSSNNYGLVQVNHQYADLLDLMAQFAETEKYKLDKHVTMATQLMAMGIHLHVKFRMEHHLILIQTSVWSEFLQQT
jgi:hypothetical protein